MKRTGVTSFALLLTLLFAASCLASAQGLDPRDPASPLRLVRTIELPNVKGRVDHMALDAVAKRLFIAENGNGSLDALDLPSGKIVGRISGLKEPQGVAWLARQQEIAVTSGDGLVTFYRSSDLQKVATVNLGADADNVRIDVRNGNLVVGYGSGGLAVIDPSTHRITRRVVLPAHPEAFEIVSDRAFVNVPGAHEIAIVDVDQAWASSTLSTGLRFANFPMASDQAGSWIAVAYRTPATLSVVDAHSGAQVFSAPTCGDADDLYFRAPLLVVICGSGSIDLVNDQAPHARVRVATERGARTGLLDAIGGHLFVAVSAGQGPAAIWELSFR